MWKRGGLFYRPIVVRSGSRSSSEAGSRRGPVRDPKISAETRGCGKKGGAGVTSRDGPADEREGSVKGSGRPLVHGRIVHDPPSRARRRAPWLSWGPPSRPVSVQLPFLRPPPASPSVGPPVPTAADRSEGRAGSEAAGVNVRGPSASAGSSRRPTAPAARPTGPRRPSCAAPSPRRPDCEAAGCTTATATTQRRAAAAEGGGGGPEDGGGGGGESRRPRPARRALLRTGTPRSSGRGSAPGSTRGEAGPRARRALVHVSTPITSAVRARRVEAAGVEDEATGRGREAPAEVRVGVWGLAIKMEDREGNQTWTREVDRRGVESVARERVTRVKLSMCPEPRH